MLCHVLFNKLEKRKNGLNMYFSVVKVLLSSFAIISPRTKGLVALLLLSASCHVAVGILRLFVMVPLVGLQCVIVAFPDHTH